MTNLPKKKKKREIKIVGLNIDKAEYQEVILSNSNRPETLQDKKKSIY